MNRLHTFLNSIELDTNNTHDLKLHPSKYIDLFIQKVDTNQVVYRTPLLLNVYWNPDEKMKTYQLKHVLKNIKPAIHSELNTLFSKQQTKYAFITVAHYEIGQNKDWCHMNTLVFSYETNTVHLFEPHGNTRVGMLNDIKRYFHDVITDKRRSFHTNKWTFVDLQTPPNKNHNGIQKKGEGNERLGLCVFWNFLVVQHIIDNGIKSIQSLYYKNQNTLRHRLVNALEPFWEDVKTKTISNAYTKFNGIKLTYQQQTCCFNQPINLTRNVVNLTNSPSHSRSR